ncbi:MAG: PAC2 family protein, partial [Actinobacteria bacterium]
MVARARPRRRRGRGLVLDCGPCRPLASNRSPHEPDGELEEERRGTPLCGEVADDEDERETEDRDAVLLLGIEPNTRWRRFTELIVGLSTQIGIELVVSLGSLLADVPHTRPSPVTGSATEEKLIEQ